SFPAEEISKWAAQIDSVEITIWLNSDLLKDASHVVGAALHEFELHVLSFYAFFQRLLAAKAEFVAKNAEEFEKLVKSIGAENAQGVYNATVQHGSVGLRANQILAAMSLLCDKVADLAKATDIENIDVTVLAEYRILMFTRNDVTRNSEIAVDPFRDVY